jgi:glycosyltransferase involved in cell wall biosynthesis
MAQELGIPVEVGGGASVRAAAADCDVLLASSPDDLLEKLGDVRPPLCVFVAHGDNVVSRHLLEVNAPLIDHVIAVSERVKQTVCQGFPTTVIPNGADLAHVSRSRDRESVRDSFGFGEDDFVLGFVGRFSEEKRPQALIEAAARLPRQFKVLLIGWGQMKSGLLEMANELIPGRFAIAEGRGHLGDYYQSMDALCLLSHSEGFGLVVMEAMLCGVPVIATPVGCAPEVIRDRVNGLIVSEDAASVAAAAALLQAHPNWARGLAKEGQLFAEKHGTSAVMGRRYEDLLHQLHAAKLNPIAPPVPVNVISYA